MNANTAIDSDFVIGLLHELPSGEIARPFGSGKDGIRYCFDDGQGERLASHDEVKAWKQRSDLTDFPNARDPRLPYTFDLFWDIKHRSELVEVLLDGHPDQQNILKTVVRERVALGKVPKSLQVEIEKAKAQEVPMSDERFEAIGQAIARSHLKTLKELQSAVDEKNPLAFENMLAFRAPFLSSVLVSKTELDRLVEKLESRLEASNKQVATDRARDALDFLDSATPASKPRA